MSTPLFLPSSVSPYSLYLLVPRRRRRREHWPTKYIVVPLFWRGIHAPFQAFPVYVNVCARVYVYIPFAQLWATSWLHYPPIVLLERTIYTTALYSFCNKLYQAWYSGKKFFNERIIQRVFTFNAMHSNRIVRWIRKPGGRVSLIGINNAAMLNREMISRCTNVYIVPSL